MIAVSIISADWLVVAFEIIILTGFAVIMRYHNKLLLLARRAAPPTPSDGILPRLRREFKFLRTYALEEYQSRLIGRVQFGALATAIGLGLFYYATTFMLLRVLFVDALIISILSTFYYIYDLQREYQEKTAKPAI